MNIGNSLIAIRKEREMTQKEVADASGISSRYLSDIEKGKKSPNLETIESICQALSVSVPILYIKAINEVNIKDLEKKRLVREIRPYLEIITKELYFDSMTFEHKLKLLYSELEKRPNKKGDLEQILDKVGIEHNPYVINEFVNNFKETGHVLIVSESKDGYEIVLTHNGS